MGKTVIFDFDGTLADTLELAVRTYNQFAPDFKSKPIQVSEIPALIKIGYWRAARAKHIRWTVIPKLIMTVSHAMKKHMHEVKPYPGIVGAITKLKTQGYTIGVLTSNQIDLVNEYFKMNKFPDFDFVASEKSLFGKDKALKKIIRARAVSREDIIYVGDEPRDISASRRAGVKFIGVSWGVAGRDGFSVEPDRLIDSADNLVAAIKELFA